MCALLLLVGKGKVKKEVSRAKLREKRVLRELFCSCSYVQGATHNVAQLWERWVVWFCWYFIAWVGLFGFVFVLFLPLGPSSLHLPYKGSGSGWRIMLCSCSCKVRAKCAVGAIALPVPHIRSCVVLTGRMINICCPLTWRDSQKHSLQFIFSAAWIISSKKTDFAKNGVVSEL